MKESKWGLRKAPWNWPQTVCPWPLTREQFQLEFGVEGRLRWGRCESRFHILEAGQGKDRGSGELITWGVAKWKARCLLERGRLFISLSFLVSTNLFLQLWFFYLYASCRGWHYVRQRMKERVSFEDAKSWGPGLRKKKNRRNRIRSPLPEPSIFINMGDPGGRWCGEWQW